MKPKKLGDHFLLTHTDLQTFGFGPILIWKMRQVRLFRDASPAGSHIVPNTNLQGSHIVPNTFATF